MSEPVQAKNPDRELWREPPGDYYAPRLFVTEGGGIGIDVGGFVVVKPIRDWHALGVPVAAAPVPDWLKKIAEELPVLAAFIRAECGPVGWEHTVNVWAERLQEYVSVPASAESQ